MKKELLGKIKVHSNLENFCQSSLKMSNVTDLPPISNLESLNAVLCPIDLF